MARRSAPSTRVADVVRPVPHVEVTPWMWLTDFQRRTHPHAWRAGAYLVGWHRSLPATVDLADPQIVCIGESHGPGTNLCARMDAFALSARLPSRGIFKHSSGNRLRDRITGPGRVSVAIVAHTGGGECHPDWRGIAPALVEGLLIAGFLAHHHRQPLLNERGRHVPYTWEPTLPDAQLASWSRSGLRPSNAAVAVAWLTSAAAVTGRRAPDVSWLVDDSDDWCGYRADVHRRGWQVYLGQYGGPGPLTFDIWWRKDRVYQRHIHGADDARAAAYVLQYRLRNGWEIDWY